METDINIQSRNLIQQLLPIFNAIYESQEDNSVLFSHNNTSFLKQIAIGIIINFTYDTIKENATVFFDKILPIIEAEGLKTSDEQKYSLFNTAYKFKFDVAIPKDEWEQLMEDKSESN